MKQGVLFLFLMFSIAGFSQTDKQNIAVITNTEPSYPKGDQALYQYVLMNVHYSEEAKKKYVQGEIMVSFDVKPDSTVSNVVIISGVGFGIDDEVEKLIRTMKFTPAVQNGTVVKMNTMYTFPVKAH